MGSPTRLALLVLIWRTWGASSYKCRSKDNIQYFQSPLPVYRISRFVNTSVINCEGHDTFLDALAYIKSSNVTENAVTLEPSSLQELIKDCWEFYLCDLPIPKTQSTFYDCFKDERIIITIETKYLIVTADEYEEGKDQCYRSLGHCFHFGVVKHMLYAWKESKNYLKFDQCDEEPIQETDSSWVGNVSTRTRYIAISNGKGTSCLRLREKFSRCGMDFWLTSTDGIVVSNLRALNGQDSESNTLTGKKNTKVIFSGGSEEDPAESQNILDKTPLLYLFILWYIAGTLFNIVVNYLTLKKVAEKKRTPSRKYLLYCLTQSLTNRYIIYLYDSVSSSAPTPGNTNNDYNNRSDSGNEYDSGGYLKPNALAKQCASDEGFNSKLGNEYSYAYMHPKRGIDF